MDTELLKAFEKVIDFYKTDPKYFDVVGTELFEKMHKLEKEMCKSEYYRCFLCNSFMVEDDVGAFDVQLDEQTIRLIFPGNDDLCDRLIKFQKNEGDVDICYSCCN